MSSVVRYKKVKAGEPVVVAAASLALLGKCFLTLLFSTARRRTLVELVRRKGELLLLLLQPLLLLLQPKKVS